MGDRRHEASSFKAAVLGAETLYTANGKFDAHQVRESLGMELMKPDGNWTADFHDVILISQILKPGGETVKQHGLKPLAERYLDDDAKQYEERIREAAKSLGTALGTQDGYYKVWQAFPEVMEAYAVFDARYTYDLAEMLLPMLADDPRAQKLYDLEREVQKILYRAERRGVAVDPAAVEHLKVEYCRRRDAAAVDCEKYLGFVPSGEGSKESLIEALEQTGIDLVEETPTGEKAVNKKALAQFEDEPPIKALFAYRKACHFLNTYIAAVDGVDVVHTDFRQMEAWTGRMSSTNPNMQNLPKRADVDEKTEDKARSVFVPRPEHYFVVADFNAIEPRILAYYLNDPDYAAIVEQSLTYEHTAALAWGGDPMQYTKDGPLGFLRPAAKQIFLSISYGAGAPRVRETINSWAPPKYHVDVGWVKKHDKDSPPQARRIKNRVTSGIPNFDAFAGRHGVIQTQIRDKGYVRTLGGRTQYVNREKPYVGLNALIQGSAADIMKMAAVNLAELKDGVPLLFVHDEVVMEYPKDYDPARAEAEVVEAMESAFTMSPRLSVEASVTDRSYAHA